MLHGTIDRSVMLSVGRRAGHVPRRPVVYMAYTNHPIPLLSHALSPVADALTRREHTRLMRGTLVPGLCNLGKVTQTCNRLLQRVHHVALSHTVSRHGSRACKWIPSPRLPRRGRTGRKGDMLTVLICLAWHAPTLDKIMEQNNRFRAKVAGGECATKERGN